MTLIEKLEQLSDEYFSLYTAYGDKADLSCSGAVDEAINIVKQHSDWISVDEPPDTDRDVLLWPKYYKKQMQGFYAGGKWYDADGEFIDSRILSFWHEQPQPPSEVQDDKPSD